VLVKVDGFYFPVDFIILDIELRSDPSQIPIILGWPFLATTNAYINYRMEANLSFENKKLRLIVFNAITGPQSDEFNKVNVLEELVKETTPNMPSQDLLQACLAHFDMDRFDIDGYMDEVNTLLKPPRSTPSWTMKYE